MDTPPPVGATSDVRQGPTTARGEATDAGWMGSSFDLLSGVEITEGEPGSIPGELFDELFNAPATRRRK